MILMMTLLMMIAVKIIHLKSNLMMMMMMMTISSSEEVANLIPMWSEKLLNSASFGRQNLKKKLLIFFWLPKSENIFWKSFGRQNLEIFLHLLAAKIWKFFLKFFWLQKYEKIVIDVLLREKLNKVKGRESKKVSHCQKKKEIMQGEFAKNNWKGSGWFCTPVTSTEQPILRLFLSHDRYLCMRCYWWTL